MPILLRCSNSGRRGPFRPYESPSGSVYPPFPSAESRRQVDPLAGRCYEGQLFSHRRSFSRNAPRYARRPVYRDSALRPFPGHEIADRFREHPGLNVNNGITAWLEDYHRRTKTKQEEGSARTTKGRELSTCHNPSERIRGRRSRSFAPFRALYLVFVLSCLVLLIPAKDKPLSRYYCSKALFHIFFCKKNYVRGLNFNV